MRRLNGPGQLALGSELDGGIERERDGGSGQVGGIGRALGQHHGSTGVAHGGEGDRPAAQRTLELPLESLLPAFLPDESEHVPGQRALGIETLRLLHQLDAVDAQRGDTR